MGEDHVSGPLDLFKLKTARLPGKAAGTSNNQERIVVIISPEQSWECPAVLVLTRQGYINTVQNRLTNILDPRILPTNPIPSTALDQILLFYLR